MNDILLPTQSLPDPLLGAPGGRRGFGGSPRDLLFVLFWHRRKVVTFFCLAMLATALAVLAIPSTYRSESSMLVKLGADSVTPDASANLSGAMVQPVMYWEVQMKTELEVLKSREIARRVVAKIGPGRILGKSNEDTIGPDDPIHRQALMALQNDLKAAVVPDSSILSVAYESKDGLLARDVVQAYVSNYLDLRGDVYTRKASADFLSGERGQTMAKVEELEGQIRQIKDAAGIGDINEYRTLLQTRIGTLQADAATVRTQRKSAEAEADVVRKRLIAGLEQNIAETRRRYGGKSEIVIQMEERLGAIRRGLIAGGADTERSPAPLNPVYGDLQKRLEAALTDAQVAAAKETAIESEIAKADASLKGVIDTEFKIKQLLRSANLGEDALKIVAQAADRAELLAAFQNEKLNNVNVVQPATLPLRPVSPNRLMLLAVGMFVAASGAVGLGLASETLSRTTKRPEDIDRISALPSVSVPVIEAVRFVGAGAGVRDRSPLAGLRKLLPGATAVESASVVTRAAGTTSLARSPSAAAGTIDVRPMRRWSPQLLHSAHGIIDGLLFDTIHATKNQAAFVTGLISCRPGQGASTLSAYVASAIADRLEASLPLHPDDRVLLVDTDMNEPTLHRLLGVEESPGLGDWLSISHDDSPSIDPYVHHTSHPRLSLMPAGRAVPVTRMLDRAELLIDHGTQCCRHIVMDLPPVSTSPTALRLAAKCNAVLLVVECGNLHQEVVRRSVRALQAAGANVVGVVLNKRRFPIPDWLYDRAS
jgi:uncharacterized protein involved in exopolysaccharide biosynthesis/Mrp family chromosome partitioning ATPase